MSWWGKIIGGGFGFLMGGPIGALLGAAFGHQFDKGINLSGQYQHTLGDQQRTQAAFFTALFSTMGHLAKADGKISKDEISMAEHVMAQMQLSSDQRRAAIELFNQGKLNDFPLDEVLQQFRVECHRRRNLLQMFLEVLIATALSDGNLHSSEHQILQHIGNSLGFSPNQLDQLINMVKAQQHYREQATVSPATHLKDAYRILNMTPEHSDEDIKKAYRRLINQHHPDKLVSKGLPDEMIKLASEKTHEIKSAYELIRKHRKSPR